MVAIAVACVEVEASVAKYRNAYLDSLVGKRVLVKQLSAPDLDEVFVDRIREDPTSARVEVLKSVSSMQVLESYDQVGVVVRLVQDDLEGAFVPWSAIIELSSLEAVEE